MLNDGVRINAPECEAFREARRDRVPAAADKANLHGRSFALEIEL
jgi:hypothetical protein